MSSLFYDPDDKRSTMRVMSFIALWTAVILAMADAFTDAEVKSEIVLGLLAAAFVPKAIQKFAEIRR